jgi:glycosyltransferase involved in cell wall biosynthesis
VNVLVGTSAYNTHVQNMVRALYEADALHAFVTGGVDSFRHPLVRLARRVVARAWPGASRQLARRSVADLPADRVRAHWGWEAPRVAASQLGFAPRLEDWAWEKGERALDRHCARLLRHPAVTAFLGVEYGALASLKAAGDLGKAGVVAFLSPHHKTRAAWVDREFDAFPELSERGRAAIDKLTPIRDARRDEEAARASWIVTGSSFTTRSMVDAGFPSGKILTVPLGGPDPIDPALLPARPSSITRFVYVGPASVRKGAPYLLRAWRRVAGPGRELHFYGKVLLPQAVIDEARRAPGGESITFHGSVPPSDLPTVYQRASALVLPTLCDGFGAVISEALAHGLPVITTHNAGAADQVTDGQSGFLIPARDEEALVQVIQRSLDRPTELFDMRRGALAAAAAWTWTDFRSTFQQVLGKALGDARIEALAAPRWQRAVS